MITDHKLLEATFKKDIASLSHRLQRIPLRIHQYNIWIQVWATAIHHRLTVQIQPWDKERQRNTWHMYYHQCSRVIQECTRLHESRTNKNSNTRWWAHKPAARTHTWWLAIYQSLGMERICSHKGHLEMRLQS